MKSAGQIHLLERDYFLHFDKKDHLWPPKNLDLLNQPKASEAGEEATGNWDAGEWSREMVGRSGGYLWRELTQTRGASQQSRKEATSLREAMIRFPSAPLFGSQSKTDYQVRMPPIHEHTMRLLTATGHHKKPRIKKLFLMFNGLNEIDRFDFYYDLAGLLIGDSEDVACLIPPFPAHLTRYPMVGRYAEKPLQRFITDPSDLFRQYLRFMVEMQWLMSVLVPVSYYPVTTGIPLLDGDVQPGRGRCDAESLSQAIHASWKAIFDNSKREESADKGREVVEADVLQAITVLRTLIGWNPSKIRLADRNVDDPLDPPNIHVIGYSLGGYLAQSVFFSWPYAIGSCSTLCSGGALHDLRPEKFIHEEEWRIITHGLKYEVESGILEGRIALVEGDAEIRQRKAGSNRSGPVSVCGIPVSFFASHFQTFNDIFLQDADGSYRHRVSEFAPRMFFVVGGNDPIVPTRTVLDTSPPEGINMIEIANLSHFLGLEGLAKGEWPTFWLPTIASIISSLSDHSETLLRTRMLENLWNDETTDRARGPLLKQRYASGDLEQAGKNRSRDAEPLDSDRIQSAILQLVNRLEDKGALLILRNQIPVSLMGQRVLHRRGTVPHYADAEIRRYWERLQQQRLKMLDHARWVTIVAPGRLNDWVGQKSPILSDKHLPVVRESSDRNRQQEIWQDFLNDWENETSALYRFNPEYPREIADDRFKLEKAVRQDTGTPERGWVLNCLPDVWVSFSQQAVDQLAGGDATRPEILTKLIERMFRIYCDHNRKRKEEHDDVDRTTMLKNWLATEHLQIIRISAAQSSPRFLGERVWNPRDAIDLLTHAALALARSQPCPAKGEFKKGWIEEKGALGG